tara:strand:- start:183398 stop:184606 length:1209 start_codon:yes stop_codon:yes gene_type:complete
MSASEPQISKQKVTILGSTGSVGVNTLRVIASNNTRYEVFALTANTQVELLFQQCLQFKPAFAVMLNKESAGDLKDKLNQAGLTTKVLSGMDGLIHVAGHEAVDSVMAAIVGGAGLLPTLQAAAKGKKVLLANKEALVMAGDLFMQTVKKSGARLLPIDSEHNAIFQCLPINTDAQFLNTQPQGVVKIVLTASGGPFLGSELSDLQQVTPEQACKHPNWNMGPKISVDCASMLNKALEVIEASFLFALPASQIDVLVHPQSVIHSMVHYRDGSVLAQLGNPDMRTPIAYGLSWPDRIAAGVENLDLSKIAQLSFLQADEERFPCLKLGKQASQAKGTAPIILNAANEIAVAAFLSGDISFTQIPVIIEGALNKQESKVASTIEEILEEDHKARVLARDLISA